MDGELSGEDYPRCWERLSSPQIDIPYGRFPSASDRDSPMLTRYQVFCHLQSGCWVPGKRLMRKPTLHFLGGKADGGSGSERHRHQFAAAGVLALARREEEGSSNTGSRIDGEYAPTGNPRAPAGASGLADGQVVVGSCLLAHYLKPTVRTLASAASASKPRPTSQIRGGSTKTVSPAGRCPPTASSRHTSGLVSSRPGPALKPGHRRADLVGTKFPTIA